MEEKEIKLGNSLRLNELDLSKDALRNQDETIKPVVDEEGGLSTVEKPKRLSSSKSNAGQSPWPRNVDVAT